MIYSYIVLPVACAQLKYVLNFDENVNSVFQRSSDYIFFNLCVSEQEFNFPLQLVLFLYR